MRLPPQVPVAQQVLLGVRGKTALESPVARFKAILDLDLCVQLMLTAVGEEHLPGNRGDVSWDKLWDAAGTEAETALPYRQQMNDLHAARNLAQHRGRIPSQEDVRESLRFVERFLDRVSEASFGRSFDELGLWSVLQSTAARESLVIGAEALAKGIPEVAIAAATLVHDAIADELVARTEFRPDREKHRQKQWRDRLASRNAGRSGLSEEASRNMAGVLDTLIERLDGLERDFVASSLGMPMDQVLRFKTSIGRSGIMQMASGLIRGIAASETQEDFESRVEAGTFGLQHVSLLCVMMEAVSPRLTEAVDAQLPTRLRELWETIAVANAGNEGESGG